MTSVTRTHVYTREGKPPSNSTMVLFWAETVLVFFHFLLTPSNSTTKLFVLMTVRHSTFAAIKQLRCQFNWFMRQLLLLLLLLVLLVLVLVVLLLLMLLLLLLLLLLLIRR